MRQRQLHDVRIKPAADRAVCVHVFNEISEA